MPRARSILGWAAALVVLAAVGCNGLSVREPWIRNAIQDRTERRQVTNQLSSATGAVLLRYDLVKAAAAIRPPQPASSNKSSRPSRCTTGPWRCAELSYQAGLLEIAVARAVTEIEAGVVSRRGGPGRPGTRRAGWLAARPGRQGSTTAPCRG